MTFKVGDKVKPKPEWADHPTKVPTGVVRDTRPWGKNRVLYVGDDPRGFVENVFEVDGAP